MYAIGIDLGTSNSVVSVFRNGCKETLRVDGRLHIPSVVSFRKNQPNLVGHAAKARLEVAPESTVSSAKRFMGDRTKSYQIHGKTYSPVDIAAQILKYVVAGAKKSLGHDVFDAVITVPAYFNDEQRADTLHAAEHVGLNVLRLQPEPSAAAICYGFEKQKNQTIMVYDLGGGTFDISILKVNSNDFDVLAVGGDSQLGGDDFDNAILEWAAGEFKKQHGINLLDNSNREYAIARQRLKEEAEKAKIELSEPECDYAEMLIPELAGHSLDLELHIDKFNDLVRPYLKRTIDCMHQVLRETNLSADDIDRIILVGGSTRIRAVRAMVSKELREPYCDENPDEAIAWGAAIVAASLGTLDVSLAPLSISEVTGHSLGIGMYNSGDRYEFTPLISKNSKYPCQGGVLGFTAAPYQRVVNLRVFRGEEIMAEKNDELGDLTVPVKQPDDEQVPVAAVFKLDKNGILHFQAVDIPLSNTHRSSVSSFLSRTFENGNMIDIEIFENLMRNGDLPKPEKISIESALR